MPRTVPHVKLADAFAAIAGGWGAHPVAEMNDYEVRIARIDGEFHWHSHSTSDEFYLVLSGRVRMQLGEQAFVELGPGELAVVPRGVEHCPHALEPSELLLVWPKGVSYRD